MSDLEDELFTTFVKGRKVEMPVNPASKVLARADLKASVPSNIPSTARDSSGVGGTRFYRKQVAQDRAVIWQYEQIYRHKMRYDPRSVQDELELTEEDIQDINSYYKQDEESQMTYRAVTVSLSKDDYEQYPDWYDKRARKASQKTYVGLCHYVLEFGDNGQGDHPHYHFVFKSEVKWLAKSRIVDEWSNTFKVAPNFIHVKPLNKIGYKEFLSYIHKEKGSNVLCNTRERKTDV